MSRSLAALIVAVAVSLAGGCGESVVTVPALDATPLETPVARALVSARERVVADPGSAEAWAELGILFDAHHFWAEASACYAEAHALAPDELAHPYSRALVVELMGEPASRSLALLDTAAAIDPEYAPLYVRRGDLLESDGRARDALAAYERALKIDEDYLKAHVQLGAVLVKLDRAADALPHLEKAHAAEPLDRATCVALSRVYRLVGREDDARAMSDAAAESSVRIGYDDPVREAVAARALDMRSCTQRAKRLMLLRDFDGAIENLRLVLEVGPDNAWAHETLGRALWGQWLPRPGRTVGSRGDGLVAARAHFERALAIDPSLDTARFDLARVAVILKDEATAIDALETLTERDPDHRQGHELLAKLLLDQRAFGRAVEHYERAAAVDSEPLSDSSLLAWSEALIEVQRPVEAEEHLRLLVSRNARNVQAQYLLAFAYALMGRDAEARSAYERGVAINPRHRLAERVGRMLR